MAKRGTTKSKKQPETHNCFRIAGFRLLAHRIFVDYITAQGVIKSIEPEHFVEDWINRFVPVMHPEEEKALWKEFMYLLVAKARQHE